MADAEILVAVDMHPLTSLERNVLGRVYIVKEIFNTKNIWLSNLI